MKSRQYLEILKETGVYKTDPNSPVRLLDRLFGKSDVWFYLRLYTILYKATHVAKTPGRYTDDEWMNTTSNIISLVEGCGGKVHIEGNEEFLKCDTPKVIVANHMCLLDTMILPPMSLIDRHGTMIIKRSLWDQRFFGRLMKEVGAIPVDRVNPRDDLKVVMTEGKKALEAGNNMVIYPQSTRAAAFNPEKFNTLGVKLATRAGVKIMHIAIKVYFEGIVNNMKDIGPLDRSKVIRLRFGPLLSPDKSNSREVHAECVSFISSTLKEWGGKIKEKQSKKR